jgi:hypothetical protein
VGLRHDLAETKRSETGGLKDRDDHIRREAITL